MVARLDGAGVGDAGGEEGKAPAGSGEGIEGGEKNGRRKSPRCARWRNRSVNHASTQSASCTDTKSASEICCDRTCKSSAHTATAIDVGALSTIPGTPIGHVIS